ncbi:hypothetical protein CEXT_543461 [Caerostris extrusa]|uniref:Uncharacterized protein n=1 Tax=Caerostris extrusa TaxID=172846 RepID=A0AAV4VNR3_CAEEX|nr:hypothetical protein CEXT_543461 [Caerostris extrusa]
MNNSFAGQIQTGTSFLLGIGCFKGRKIKQRGLKNNTIVIMQKKTMKSEMSTHWVDEKRVFPNGAAAACSNPAIQNSLEQKNPRSNRPETFAPCSEGAAFNIRICF